tara:strand:+ start:352 stop:549 length:198 start_codon:yes stop_codon:yes gene_type:complete
MKSFRISEILYFVVAILSSFETISLWNSNTPKAYLFIGFACLSTFMGLFRRYYRKKFNQRSNKFK